MGGVVNTGRNNDDLIDKLLAADYIRSAVVESVFRAVDRADYFPPEVRRNAYKDLAWKGDHLHLSAPCIYSEVMEGLCLSPGLSFLNLGSGTGYLSTMVGLILGCNGINHGVEIHDDVVEYANKKLEEFKKNSGAIDEFDFCEPKFIQGNCLCLTTNRQYDRVYCGAACPEHYETYMKNLLNIDGILVMPLNDNLIQIKRISEVSWESKPLLPVSFASLIQPIEGKQEIVEIVEVVPLSLQSLSRTVIRSILRRNIELENPNLRKRKSVPKCGPSETALRGIVGPIFDDSGDDPFTSDDEPQFYISNNRRTTDNIFGVVMEHMRERRSSQEDNGSIETRSSRTVDDDMDMELPSEGMPREINEVRNIINNPPRPLPMEVVVESVLDNVFMQMRGYEEVIHEDPVNNEEDASRDSEQNNIQVQNEVQEELPDDTVSHEVDKPAESTTNTDSVLGEETSKKREKFDSGLGDEMVEKEQFLDSSENEHMDVDSSSSNDEMDGKRNKRGSRNNPEARSGAKWRRICLRTSDSCSSSSETVQEDAVNSASTTLTRQRHYTMLMRSKIQELPLPPTLKNYLNFYREF